MLALPASVAAALDVGDGEPVAPATVAAPSSAAVQPVWRNSFALGAPSDGRLVRGVMLPAEGPDYFTWDPVLHEVPNRAWRRWGTDRLVRFLLGVIRGYTVAHPGAPRVGIGDLSKPRGGPFGPVHATHQNGLDADVYYPRRDRRERPPKFVSQIDRRLAQDLLDRFVAAGAQKVFTGPRLHLRGPKAVVVPLVHHDDHMHVRIR